MLLVSYFLNIIFILAFILSIILLILNLFCDSKKYTIIKISLIIYQLILGISIIFVFEKSNSFIAELFTLLTLILNTISLIIFNIKNNKIRKELKKMISIVSIPAILCGLAFSINYTIVIIRHNSLGYDNDVREILYLDEYSKGEAKDLLDNIYHALRPSKDSEDCLKLYGIIKDDNKNNEYFINIKENCLDMYFPPNATKMVVNEKDSTKIDRIYWQFNDDIEITFYENKKQVDNFAYLYYNAMYSDEPQLEIKNNFEKDVKSKLKSPSAAKFTYDTISYDSNNQLFAFNGYVESQNSYGAILKEEFRLNILPCEDKDSCRGNSLNYSWYFTNLESDGKESIVK